MARRRGGRGLDYDWVSTGGSNSAIDLAVGVAALGSGSIDINSAATIMRTRGLVAIQLDATAVDERALIAVGIIVVSDNALAAGTASVPAPFTDSSDDWLWYDFMWVSSGAEGAVVSDFLAQRTVIDSKAMRKVKAGENLALVVEVVVASDQGGSFDLQYGFRSLSGR